MATMYITTKGAELLAKTLQSKTLQFSKFSVGSGTLSDTSVETIKALTALVSLVMNFDITKISKDTETQVTVKGLFKNTNEEAFYLRELGLFAIDPDTQEEVLFSYINYGDEAEYINTSDNEVLEHYYKIPISVDNAENVSISVNENTIYVTEQEFDIANQIEIGTVTIPTNTTITNGYQVTLPIQYQVGNNSLELRLNSEVLKLATDTTDGHYKEVRNCRNTK